MHSKRNDLRIRSEILEPKLSGDLADMADYILSNAPNSCRFNQYLSFSGQRVEGGFVNGQLETLFLLKREFQLIFING